MRNSQGDRWITVAGHVADSKQPGTANIDVVRYRPRLSIGQAVPHATGSGVIRPDIDSPYTDVAAVQSSVFVGTKALVERVHGPDEYADVLPILGAMPPYPGMPVELTGIRGGTRSGIVDERIEASWLLEHFGIPAYQEDRGIIGAWTLDMDDSGFHAILDGDSGGPIFVEDDDGVYAVGATRASTGADRLRGLFDSIFALEHALGLFLLAAPQTTDPGDPPIVLPPPFGGGYTGPNVPPFIFGISDQLLSVGSTSAVLHSRVFDADPYPNRFLYINWEVLSAPAGDPNPVIANPSAASTSVTLAGIEGSYRFRIVAFDGLLHSSRTMTVTVEDQVTQPPLGEGPGGEEITLVNPSENGNPDWQYDDGFVSGGSSNLTTGDFDMLTNIEAEVEGAPTAVEYEWRRPGETDPVESHPLELDFGIRYNFGAGYNHVFTGYHVPPGGNCNALCPVDLRIRAMFDGVWYYTGWQATTWPEFFA